MGLLALMQAHKLIFIETKDIVETTLSLNNYKKACDIGRGAVFISVARGKVAEGIDFDRHYGRCVVIFGIPYQYTLSHVLRARLVYLRDTFAIREQDFLTFDALRQSSQCIGRIIRSKKDYGIIVFADKRYASVDKRSKLPQWVLQFLPDAHISLTTDMAIHLSRRFLKEMAQPVPPGVDRGKTLLSLTDIDAMHRAAGLGSAMVPAMRASGGGSVGVGGLAAVSMTAGAAVGGAGMLVAPLAAIAPSPSPTGSTTAGGAAASSSSASPSAGTGSAVFDVSMGQSAAATMLIMGRGGLVASGQLGSRPSLKPGSMGGVVIGPYAASPTAMDGSDVLMGGGGAASGSLSSSSSGGSGSSVGGSSVGGGMAGPRGVVAAPMGNRAVADALDAALAEAMESSVGALHAARAASAVPSSSSSSSSLSVSGMPSSAAGATAVSSSYGAPASSASSSSSSSLASIALPPALVTATALMADASVRTATTPTAPADPADAARARLGIPPLGGSGSLSGSGRGDMSGVGALAGAVGPSSTMYAGLAGFGDLSVPSSAVGGGVAGVGIMGTGTGTDAQAGVKRPRSQMSDAGTGTGTGM